MRRFFSIVLLTLVLLTVALVSALTAMRLAIHGREVVTPKVVGMSPLEAERAGSAAGLQVAVEREFYSADVPEGRIINQMPLAGTKVRRGWAIRVARSLGPQRVAIPDVTGESERAAELNIRRRGLALGSVAQIGFPRGFAQLGARAGCVAKSTGECERSCRAQDQSACEQHQRAGGLCYADLHRAAARQRDAGLAGLGHARRQSELDSRAHR